jgi:hypothetical protein
MTTAIKQDDLKPLERRTLQIGFVLVGLAIAVTAVSYLLNMTFVWQWLVWVIGAAFLGVALLTIEWPRAFRRFGELPQGTLRSILLVSMPLSYILASQYCGLGLEACNVVCQVTNLSLIGLTTWTAVRMHRNQSIGPLMVAIVGLSLVPHCTCDAPINELWHGVFGSVAPTCAMVPLAATLFSVSALRGARPRLSAALSSVMLVMIVFIAVGNPTIGFPWQGCV